MDMIVIKAPNCVGALFIGTDPENIGHGLAVCAQRSGEKGVWIAHAGVLCSYSLQTHRSSRQQARFDIFTPIQMLLRDKKSRQIIAFPLSERQWPHLRVMDSSK